MKMRKSGVFVLATLLLVPLGGSSSGASASCRAQKDAYYIHTLDVTLEFDKKEYEIGDTVVASTHVTRTTEDPLATGNPLPNLAGEPVAGADVGVGLFIGRVYLPGGAATDANGDAIVRIKLENYAPEGKLVDTRAYATKWIAWHPPCNDYYEDGYIRKPEAFKTR